MALFEHDVLLASIDQTLATLRAALAARADEEQTDEARIELARRAAIELANLPSEAGDEWQGVPDTVFDAIEQAKQVGREGSIDGVHDHLVRARESMAGRSR
jgi:hypothetical protein